MMHQDLMQICRKAAPREACGFIVDGGQILVITNVSTENHHFQMDTDEVLNAYENYTIEGVWHTHPDGADYPSMADIAMHDPTLDMVIATPTKVRVIEGMKVRVEG